MVQQDYINIQLSGESFSPKTLKKHTKLPIDVLVEAGEIAKKGRYKDKTSPYGLGIITIEASIDSIEKWCEIFLNFKNYLEISKLQEIVFDTYIDCTNLRSYTITSELAGKLNKLNASINFTQLQNTDYYDSLLKILKDFNYQKEFIKTTSQTSKIEILDKIWKNQKLSPEFSKAMLYILLKEYKLKDTIDYDRLKDFLKKQEKS
ncbi:hypothetical protein [Tenacibaculum ascidiaceicola]|uniref:hypothetical protein n=1 Tax=Tenacibaculum ascidiaceicola TaxID=1699411 RepID=UPI003CE55009